MRNFTPSRLTSMTSICVIALVSGCTTSMPAPVQDRTSRSAAGPLSQQLLPPVPVVVSPASPALPGSTAGSQFYVVQRGETLYGIARANTTDINALAAWNNIIIGQPLREGQVLRLQPPSDTAVGMPATPSSGAPSATLTPIPTTGAIQGQPLPAGPTAVITSVTPIVTPVAPVTSVETPLKREPRSQRVPYSDAALASIKQGEATAPLVSPPGPTASAPVAPASTTSPSLSTPPGTASTAPAPLIEAEVKPGAGVDRDGIAWTWPTSGKVTSKFNDKAPMKGIDIAANAGTPVVAAAAGKVIYVGKEPRGYGQMIVVSHAKETVSVYFHTDKLLVKEQQRVLVGQRLGEVGDSAGNKLHFEVRRQGRPLDPLSLMPR